MIAKLTGTKVLGYDNVDHLPPAADAENGNNAFGEVGAWAVFNLRTRYPLHAG